MSEADKYSVFLQRKALRARDRGLARAPQLASHLFAFQQLCVEHHLRVGAGGCFLDTGLGKTEVQLEFCQRAIEATNDKAIVWTPLAVAGQTKRRAEKWGYEARVIRQQADARPGINICNYERGRMKTFRFIPLHLAEDYLKLGWLLVADLGHPHNQWSVLGEWVCSCCVREPRRGA